MEAQKGKRQAIAPEVKRNHSVPFPCACHGVFVTPRSCGQQYPGPCEAEKHL